MLNDEIEQAPEQLKAGKVRVVLACNCTRYGIEFKAGLLHIPKAPDADDIIFMRPLL